MSDYLTQMLNTPTGSEREDRQRQQRAARREVADAKRLAAWHATHDHPNAINISNSSTEESAK